jgi:hypothetical protein
VENGKSKSIIGQPPPPFGRPLLKQGGEPGIRQTEYPACKFIGFLIFPSSY